MEPIEGLTELHPFTQSLGLFKTRADDFMVHFIKVARKSREPRQDSSDFSLLRASYSRKEHFFDT